MKAGVLARLAGALLLMAAVAWLVWPRPRAAALPASVAGSQTTSLVSRPAAPNEVVAASSATTMTQNACPHQVLNVQIANAKEAACVGPAQVQQSGSTRRYRFAAEGLSAWSLEVGVVGTRAVGAALTSGRRRYRCDQGRCEGFAIGPADAHGARRIDVVDAGLRASAADEGPVTLSASLEVGPQPQRTCIAPVLNVVDANGSAAEFCPDGGAGFELGDDGRLRYRFDALDGQTLSVTLDSAGQVRDAALGGLACTAAACAGLISPGGAPGNEHEARTFDFSNVHVAAANGEAATLNGRLDVPAQK